MGHIFVGDKEGGEEFTKADEETLVTFASQATLVIANARTHRQERRARADLETLMPLRRWEWWSWTPSPVNWCLSTGRLCASWRPAGGGAIATGSS